MPVDDTQTEEALVASGSREALANNSNPLELYLQGHTGTQNMQEKAWTYFDTVGEVSFYGDSLVGGRISKMSFPIGWDDIDGVTKILADVDHGLTEKELAVLVSVHGTLKTKAGGAPEFWSLIAKNIAIGAQAKLLLEKSLKYFTVMSPLELKKHQKKHEHTPRKKYPHTRTFNVWQPHPKKPSKPYTALWSSFPTIDSLWWITRYIDLRTRNRLVQNDILSVPNSITPPDIDEARSDSQGVGPETKLNNFEHYFRRIAQQNLANVASEKAPMPMIAFIPDGAEKALKWVTSEHKIDPTLLVYVHQLRERFANNVSVPSEMITGVGGANHWNAALIEDDLENSHLMPLANMISMSVTLAYFRAAVRANAEANGMEFPEDKLERIRIFPVSTRKQEGAEYVGNVLRAYEAGIIGEDPVADALGIPRQHILSLAEQQKRADIKNTNRTNVTAPSRQPDQRNRPPGSPDPERSRSGNSAESVWQDMLAYDMHRTAGNRLLNYAKRDQDILDGLAMAKSPDALGRYATRSTLTALGIQESKLWEGLSDRIKTAARHHPNPEQALAEMDDIAQSIMNGFWEQ